MATRVVKVGPIQKQATQLIELRVGAIIRDVIIDDNTAKPMLLCELDPQANPVNRRFNLVRHGMLVPAGGVYCGCVSFGGDNAVMYEVPV